MYWLVHSFVAGMFWICAKTAFPAVRSEVVSPAEIHLCDLWRVNAIVDALGRRAENGAPTHPAMRPTMGACVIGNFSGLLHSAHTTRDGCRDAGLSGH
jgi:hypothetical protein